MSKVIADTFRQTGASSDAITLDSSGNVTFPGNATCSGTATGFGGGGKLLNVVQQVYTTANSSGSIAADTEWDTAMTVTITPSAATSKVLIEGTLHMCGSQNGIAIGLRLKSDAGGSEAIITGTTPSSPGSRVAAYAGAGDNWDDSIKNISFKFLHSPNTTSAVQYKVYAVHDKSSNTVIHINRSQTDDNSTADSRYCSFMFATEIGA